MKGNVQERLYQFEVNPPEGVWEAISRKLDEGMPPVVQMEKRQLGRTRGFRIAIAAAIALLLGLGAFFMLNRNTGGNAGLAGQSKLPPPPQPNPGQAVQPSRSDPAPSVVISNTPVPPAARPQLPRPKPGSDNPAPAITRPGNQAIALEARRQPQPGIIVSKAKNSQGKVEEDIEALGAPNSLITITGPNGQPVKVSAKLANVIRYLNDKGEEEYIDRLIRESAIWRNRFREWKEKMAKTPFAPSPANFLDINQLVETLQEKN